MDKIYLIMFDNGGEYSDHDSYSILSCGSEEEAKSIVKDIYEWEAETKDKIPEPPPGREQVQLQQCSQEYQTACEEHLKIRDAIWESCPYGGGELGWKAMEYIHREKQYCENNETFYYIELPYVEL